MGTDKTQLVALNGSPHRNGNTATLMRWVVEGCQETGAAVEWIDVIDHDIGYCQGCFTCLRTGACGINDGLTALRDQLLAADGLVVGSPVYEGEPTAQLKTLMDRLTLLNLYTNTFEGKRTVGVTTSGVAPTIGLAKRLADFFGQRSGVIGAKTASISKGYQPLADVHPSRLPERARELGRRLIRDIERPQRRLPSPMRLWVRFLRRFVVRPLVEGNPDQFAGVLAIWKEKGWL